MKTDIKPLGDRVLIEPVSEEADKTKSGIYLPETAEKILAQFGIKVDYNNFDWEKEKKWGTIEAGTKIIKTEALFPRIQ